MSEKTAPAALPVKTRCPWLVASAAAGCAACLCLGLLCLYLFLKPCGRGPAPVSAPASAARPQSGGDNFACTVADAHKIVCAGVNGRGQLGTGFSSGPGQHILRAEGVRLIASGSDFTCFTSGRGVSCFGDNRWRQAGDSDTQIMPVSPLPFFRGRGVESLTAGSVHACALSGGSVFCWGSDYAGQMGSGKQGGEAGGIRRIVLPKTAGRPVAVSAFSFATCVLTDKHKSVCFGSNADKTLSGSDAQYLPPTVARKAQ